LAALGGAATGLIDGAASFPFIAAALAFAFVAGLLGDAWFGIVIGLAASAGLTLTRQIQGTWLPSHFGTAAIETVAVMTTGWSAGWAGGFIRSSRGRSSDRVDAPGVFGSLGMVPWDMAQTRLQEEVARATMYGRPLSLLMLDIELMGPDLDDQSRHEVNRGVARITESRLRDTDVPFAVSAQRMGAILPETDHAAATIAVGRILEAVVDATYMDRVTGTRGSVGEVASVRVGVASLGGSVRDAAQLTAAAMETVMKPAPEE
jgi:GGDEF domain-containing protein